MHIQGLSTLGGLVLSIQRFHLWGLQLDIYHNKVQQYQWRQFHYTSLLVQQWPTPFKNTLLINSALSQNYKKQMKLYPLEYYYIKPWQSHTPSSKLWWPHTLHYWNHNGLMHHTAGIFATSSSKLQ